VKENIMKQSNSWRNLN